VVPAEAEEDGTLRDEVVRSLSQESAFNDYLLCETRNGVTERIREAHNGERGWIEIETENGLIRLRGQVGSLTHRRLADVLAWWSGGCEDVDNDLRVVPAEKDNDGELADAVRIVLEKDPLVHADQLNVMARDGQVTLHGSVASREERRLAKLDAWYVLGVHEVQDRIQTHG
jgi:osmotically-inducible protein OsmY